MSRIHEALEKAERERSLRNGTRDETGDVVDLYAAQPATVSIDGASAQGFAKAASAPVPISPAEMLNRCQQADWHPQAAMLFLNGQQGIFGNEEFRTLRSRLYQLQEHRPLRKLLITSPLPQEGKTFVAANLAQAIACQEDRRVLLIDGDLRRGRLHECLGTSGTPGLSNYLQNENGVTEFGVMQRGSMKNFVFIPAGAGVPNPTELVGNGRIRKLLSRLEPLFDWIILDSPPSNLVSDATILADCCDGVLTVVRSNVTRSDAILRARDEFGEGKLIGAVLNGVQTTSPAYYGPYVQKS